MIDTGFLEGLNPPQREAVTHGEGPLLILAGAGSGKTRVITYRIAHLLSTGVNPWNILAVTFTNKAAAEMRQRVERLVAAHSEGPGNGAVLISTFHSFCAQFLRAEARTIGFSPQFVIYDESDQKQLIKDCLRDMNLDDTKYKPGPIVTMISRAKDDLLDAESYAIHSVAQNDPFRQLVATVYALYQKKLDMANALDFGDLILKTVFALRDVPELKEKYQARFRHLMVDEYQDTNHAQYLLTKYLIAPPKNICVVGDDDQSIYSWRGADIRNIMEFEKDYPGAAVVKLEQNYRSTKPILDAAWNIVKHNGFRKEKKLWTDRAGGDPVYFREFANELDEARFVVRTIGQYNQGDRKPFSEFAVFYRTNAQSRVLEDAFRREKIPYQLIGDVRFYERMEIKDALAYARVMVNPMDSISLKRIINVPPRGIGKTTLQTLDQYAVAQNLSLYETMSQVARVPGLNSPVRLRIQGVMELLGRLVRQSQDLTAVAVIQRILETTGYWDYWQQKMETDTEAADRLDNLQELVNAAREFEDSSEDKSLRMFLEKITLASDVDSLDNAEDPENAQGSVTLMTVHLAKGLEFPVVFLTGLEEGLFPIGESAFSETELEEERRLCYVGVTRARDKLLMTSAASRKIYGRSNWNIPSRFIKEAGVSRAPAQDENAAPEVRERAGAVIRSFDPDEADKVPGRRPLRVGMRVRHSVFGPGIILNKNDSRKYTKLDVLFDTGEKKSLLVPPAVLDVMDA
ncbi:MAG TPA: UvrD-helicase domain-containing protein [Elusimicrobiota bacterium]|nr:UvrD-helicase domain-containing protein [Elusimicrobiota bacterium]